MKRTSWAVALVVFLIFFGSYSYRLGIDPIFFNDDYEYTYPAFSLVERGNLGSPLLGTGFNIENRTYDLTVYYYATVHAVLIRLFGDGPASIPLANTFHFALLAAVGTLFFVRRSLLLGSFAFLLALASDPRMVEAARQGRPEMTAGACLTLGVLFLWLWTGENQRRPIVLFGTSAAFVAGMFSHSSILFFAIALLLVFGFPLARTLRPRDAFAFLLPYLAIPVLYSYFVMTDSAANVWGQMAKQQSNVMLLRFVSLPLQGQWGALTTLIVDFLQLHVWDPALWLGITACLAAPLIVPSFPSRGARFFAAVYLLFLLVHFLFLKHFVLSYRVLYQPLVYLAFAFLLEAFAARLAESWKKPAAVAAVRMVGVVTLLALWGLSEYRFHSRLRSRALPYARLQGALVYALEGSGARPGDRVLIPGAFGFHLRRRYDTLTNVGPRHYQGRWSPEFRDGLREIWGPQTLARVDTQSLCRAMGLAFLRPTWVMTWNGDYSTMQPFRQFMRTFPDLPGIQLTPGERAFLPTPYLGIVRVYRLDLSDAVLALDRSVNSAQAPCP